jgi:hypothetical protein
VFSDHFIRNHSNLTQKGGGMVGIPVDIRVGAVPCDRPKAGYNAMTYSSANMNRRYGLKHVSPKFTTVSIKPLLYWILRQAQDDGGGGTKVEPEGAGGTPALPVATALRLGADAKTISAEFAKLIFRF